METRWSIAFMADASTCAWSNACSSSNCVSKSTAHHASVPTVPLASSQERQAPQILARTLVLKPVAGLGHSQLHELRPRLLAELPLIMSNHRVEQEYNAAQHPPF